MAAFTIGDVVLVAFPFSDLSASKVRPALVVSPVGGTDYLLCMITSKAYKDPMAIPVPEKDSHASGLLVSSFVRPAHLFSSSANIVRRKIGHFSPDFIHQVKLAISDWVLPGGSSGC